MCLVMYAGIGVCVGGMVVYVLWVFLAEVEGDSWGCASCKLSDGCVKCGKDVCSVEQGEGFFVGYEVDIEFGATSGRSGCVGWVIWEWRKFLNVCGMEVSGKVWAMLSAG